MLMLTDVVNKEGLIVFTEYRPDIMCTVVTVENTFGERLARKLFPQRLMPRDAFQYHGRRDAEINYWLWTVILQVNPNALS